jgi:hypothetical protein
MVQEMPTRIVMVNGQEFVVDMGVDVAASEILVGSDPRAKLDAGVGGETKTVYVMRGHIAYAEDYVYPEARPNRGPHDYPVCSASGIAAGRVIWR